MTKRRALTSLGMVIAVLSTTGVASAQEAQPVKYIYEAEGLAEATLMVDIPAENARALVPDHYTITTYLGLDGQEKARLFVFANRAEHAVFDGKEVGEVAQLHLAIEIQPPEPPPGKTIDPGAPHVYEVSLIMNNAKLVALGENRTGLPLESEQELYFEHAPSLSDELLGYIYAEAPQPYGFSSESLYEPVLPLDPTDEPLLQTYFWYEGDKGLVIGQIDQQNTQGLSGSAAAGAVCADAGSWFADHLGGGCRDGSGLGLEVDALRLTFEVYDLEQ